MLAGVYSTSALILTFTVAFSTVEIVPSQWPGPQYVKAKYKTSVEGSHGVTKNTGNVQREVKMTMKPSAIANGTVFPNSLS